MTPHLPRHQLEELAVDQGDAAQRAHVAACERCAERLRALGAARAAFLERRDPAQFARRVAERSRRGRAQPPRSWLAAGALAAALAAALLWMRSSEQAEAIRFKGTRSLQVFVKRGGVAEPLHDGEALAAGDQLAFTYSLEEPRHLLLLSIDDTGAVTRYYPNDGLGGKPLAATRRAQLPIGVELDEHRGEERLFALFSPEPIDEARTIEALRAALREALARGVGITGMGRVALPLEQTSYWFRKP